MLDEAKIELDMNDERYPSMLKDLPTPPQRIYVLGDPGVLSSPSLSIIGARKATPYGRSPSGIAAKLAAEAGLTVVSGGAVGCDQAAGRAAIQAHGRHVAVLGTGADIVYPRSSKILLQETIESGGAIVSIEPWGTPPQRWAFPKRNKVIAALSQALFIAEAGLPSGTFSTAETSMDLGREILVAPGSVFAPESRGANYLISNGACCISDIESLEIAISRIYGTLRSERSGLRNERPLSTQERSLIDILRSCPMRSHELARELKLDAAGINCLLGGLECEGLIQRLLDGRFSLSETALYESGGMRQNR